MGKGTASGNNANNVVVEKISIVLENRLKQAHRTAACNSKGRKVLCLRRGIYEKSHLVPQELLWTARRLGASGVAPFEETKHFYYTNNLPHKSLQLPGTVLMARVMQRCGWTSGKSDEFSAFDVQPIRRQKPLVLRSTMRRRRPAPKNHCHSRPFQLPLISFQSSLLGSAETGASPISDSRAVASCIRDLHPAIVAQVFADARDEARPNQLRLCGCLLTERKSVKRSAGIQWKSGVCLDFMPWKLAPRWCL